MQRPSLATKSCRPRFFCKFARVDRLVVRVLLFLVLLSCRAVFAQIINRQPAPIIATSSEGENIRGFGDIYIYDVSPDFQPGNVIQSGNRNPKIKIRPKKSWEIEDNLFGATPAGVPRSAETDRHFNLPVNLIDGDPKTAWTSRAQPQPNFEPEWIRLDLPQERMIQEIVLLPRSVPLPERGVDPEWGPTARYLDPLPKKLTIKVSLDAWHWDTVYQTDNLEAPPKMGAPMRFRFPVRRVKQIWIIGENFGLMVSGPFIDFWGHCWSLAEVQALDDNGFNWALASRGTGVTTSSTNYGYQGKRQELADWWSLHYDMGLKWLRVAFWDSVLQWNYVEQKKGIYQVDPLADEMVTEAADYGVKVVMGLEYSNWLYADHPKSNFAAGVETIPFDPPPVPWSESQVEAYKNFVRFMVGHFKGRVYAWELWNEPLQDHRYGWGHDEEGIHKYAEIIQQVVPIIRQEDPKAKIVASGTLGPAIALVAPLVDIIDVVRYYEASLDGPLYRNEPEEVERYEAFVRSKGFKGSIFFSEENQWHGSPYPYPIAGVKEVETTEIGQAKNLARTMVRHAGLGLVSFWNETWDTALTTGDVGLLRFGFPAGPSNAMTARPGYYVYRTLCTVLADAKPDPSLKIEVTASVGNDVGNRLQTPLSFPEEVFDHWQFVSSHGTHLAALWQKGEARDYNKGTCLDVAVDLPVRDVEAIDTLNGVEQGINFEKEKGHTLIRGLCLYDYPVILRMQ
jgi:hypothetical protein